MDRDQHNGAIDHREVSAGGEARRRKTRYPIEWTVSVQCEDWASASQIATVNVSRGGMFLTSTHPAPVGAKVRVLLRLPDAEQVEIRATVRHVLDAKAAAQLGRKPGIGVEVADESKAELLALCEIARLRQSQP